MNYISACCTDAGSINRINQDSLCLLSAEAYGYEYILAAVCDGLGGLSEGQNASAYAVRRLSEWFETVLPELLREQKSVLEIRKELDTMLQDSVKHLNEYARENKTMLGTTMTLILSLGCFGKIISAHIGDTRIYRTGSDCQEIITTDHSLLSELIRNGDITKEEAENDSRQNQLTKCMGAGIENPAFDYSIIPADTETVWLICSDGFRKTLTADEISDALRPELINSDSDAENQLKKLTDMCISRGETDNISSLVIRLI